MLPACADRRLTMAATGSPGAMRGIKKIRVVPSHTVRKNIPRRRTTYPSVKLPMVLLLPPTNHWLASRGPRVPLQFYYTQIFYFGPDHEYPRLLCGLGVNYGS